MFVSPTRPLTRRVGPRPGRAALVALAACLLVVSACGSSGGSRDEAAGGGTSDTVQPLSPCPLDALASASPPVEVVLWHPFVAKTKDTLEAMVAQYNASQTKVKVRVEAQGSYNELAAKYRAAVPSKDLPGIAIFEDTNTKSVADSGTILPAQSCIDADHYDTSDLLDSVKAFYSVGGALFPSSANISTPLLYVNRNHFRKAGLDPDKPPTTLAEIRADAEKLKAAGVVDRPMALSLQPWFVESWLNGEGAPIVDNDNGRGPGQTTEAAFDNDQTREIYTWIRDMNRDGLLTAVPNTDGNIDDYLAMAQQKTSMIIESSVAATSIKAFLKGDLDPSTLQGGGGAAPSDPNALDIGAALVPRRQRAREGPSGRERLVHHQHHQAGGAGRGVGLHEVVERDRPAGALEPRGLLPALPHLGGQGSAGHGGLDERHLRAVAGHLLQPVGQRHQPGLPRRPVRPVRQVHRRHQRQHRVHDLRGHGAGSRGHRRRHRDHRRHHAVQQGQLLTPRRH